MTCHCILSFLKKHEAGSFLGSQQLSVHFVISSQPCNGRIHVKPAETAAATASSEPADMGASKRKLLEGQENEQLLENAPQATLEEVVAFGGVSTTARRLQALRKPFKVLSGALRGRMGQILAAPPAATAIHCYGSAPSCLPKADLCCTHRRTPAAAHGIAPRGQWARRASWH